MTEGKAKASFLTFLMKIAYSVLTTITSLILTNLIIKEYGPIVNGLSSSINQFVNLFSVFEGGITTAAIVATYNPVMHRDYATVNGILTYTRRFLIKVSILFLVVTSVVGCIYICIIDSPYTFNITFIVLMLSVIISCISMSVLPQYYILLQGNNKEYVISVVNCLVKVISFVLSVVFIYNHQHIIFVFVANLVGAILNIVIFEIYQRRKYPYVDYKKGDVYVVSGTKDVLLQKILNIIFNFTDIFLISVFISLVMASVYNLNNQIYNSIYILVSAAITAPYNSIGILMRESREKFKKIFGEFRLLSYIIISVFYTATGSLLESFMQVYISDAVGVRYYIPILNLLLFSFFFFRSVSQVYAIAINASGKFKLQNKQLIIAMITNIVVSAITMLKFGIIGVILGSVCAMLIMLFMNIIKACKQILEMPVRKELWLMLIYFFVSCIMIKLSGEISYMVNVVNYWQWGVMAICVVLVMLVVFVLLSTLLQYSEMKMLLQYIKTKWFRNK